MTENEIMFIRTQFRKTGLEEAFTPALVEQLKKGEATIEHPFKKNYDGDEVSAKIYLKKSASSDHYFLNKYDLQLKKEGIENERKQTFYINRHGAGDDGGKREDRFTLKESYNLLSGRPVYKTLFNQNDEQYNAWVRLDFKNTLNNGNYEMKRYSEKYGFNLEKVLADYNIKDLANPAHKASLIKSLERGNLQQATFIAENGKEHKLYISPNITFGSLNIYDQNKQKIPTEKLVENGFIIKQKEEKPAQNISKEQKVTSESNQKVKAKDTLKEEGPSQKKSLRKWLHL